MELKAFDLIVDKLTPALLAQEFSAPEDYEVENGKAKVFMAGDLAYGVFYDAKTKRFELKSATLQEGQDVKWKSLSTWMFEPEGEDISEAESIANDFLETVEGPKRIEMVRQNKKKRNKKDDGTLDADPQFLFNRLMAVFPELREEMAQERVRYGRIRYFTFAKENIAHKAEALAKFERCGDDNVSHPQRCVRQRGYGCPFGDYRRHPQLHGRRVLYGGQGEAQRRFGQGV